MFQSFTLSFFAVTLLLAANFIHAEDMKGMENGKTQPVASSTVQVHKGHGVANKINARAGKINISHEPIVSINWPKMTMDFSVENKAELEAIKPGMAVDFDLAEKGSGYRIVNIKPSK